VNNNRLRDQSGLHGMASEEGPKCKDPKMLDITLYVTCWGLAPCGTAMCCRHFGETCYLHLQTQNDWSHVTAENPSWCRDRYVVGTSPLTGPLVCPLSKVIAMRVRILSLHTGRVKGWWSLGNSKYSVSIAGRNWDHLRTKIKNQKQKSSVWVTQQGKVGLERRRHRCEAKIKDGLFTLWSAP
jgi:hypothetical protein